MLDPNLYQPLPASAAPPPSVTPDVAAEAPPPTTTDDSGVDPDLLQQLHAAAPGATTDDSDGGVDPDLLKALNTAASASPSAPKGGASPPKSAYVTPPGKGGLSYAQKVAQIEASGNPNAANGHAVGLGQFMPGTWLPLIKSALPNVATGKTDAQLLALRTDPNVSLQMIGALGDQSAAQLTTDKIPVTDATKYGMHFLGPRDFPTLYNADPTQPVTSLPGLGPAIANNKAIFLNKDGSPRTVGQVNSIIAGKMGAPAGMPAPAGAPESWSDALANPGQSLAQLGSTAQQAVQNAPASFGHLAAGLYDTVTHPMDTLNTLGQIATGLNSKIEGYAGRPQNPVQKAKDEQLVNALATQIGGHWSTFEGANNYIANDPAAAMADASAVLSLGEGALGTVGGTLAKAGELARVGTGVGDAVQAAGRAVGTAGRMVNPLDPLGVVSGTVGALAPTAARVTDQAGALIPKAASVVSKATDGMVTGDDVAALDPEAQQGLVGTLAEKGATVPAANEGVLRSLGLNTPTSVVTGIAAPEGARAEVAAAVAENNEKIAAQAQQLAGASEPNSHAIGQALEQAHVTSANQAAQNFENLKALPGSFGPTVNGADLNTEISSQLDAKGLPSTPMLLDRSAAQLPQTRTAVQLLNRAMVNGEPVLSGVPGISADLNMPELMAIRRQLTGLQQAADGEDIAGVRAVTDAFHNYVEGAADAGKFVDPATGQPVTGMSQMLREANAGYGQHFDTFENRVGPNKALADAVKTLKSGQTRDPAGAIISSNDEGLQQAAQGKLAAKLFDPTQGPATYNALSRALGPENLGPVDDFIKQSALTSTDRGLAVPKRVAAQISDPKSVVAKAFSDDPQGLAKTRLIHAAYKINNTKPPIASQSHNMLSGIWGKALARAATGAIGYHAHGIPGLIAGEALEGIGEHMFKGIKARKAMAGAPKPKGPIRAAGALARRAVSRGTVLPAAYLEQANEMNRPVPARAQGGRTESAEDRHKRLVQRLMDLAEVSKRSVKAQTKPLLDVPDATITRALELAKQGI